MKPVKHSHLNVLLIAALLVALGLVASTASAGAPPTLISYQGLVKVSGVPYDGAGYFKFWIVNAATGDGTSYWQTGPEALTVSNGLFNFMLGSTTALPSSVLDNDPIYLRVWFSQTSGGTFQALEPNQRIGSVAYALRAEHATTAGNADTLDSQHASAFAASSHNHSGSAITSGTIASPGCPRSRGRNSQAFRPALPTARTTTRWAGCRARTAR